MWVLLLVIAENNMEMWKKMYSDVLISAVITHVCSLGPTRCHSNLVDSGHRTGRRCGTSTWGTGRSWGHMTQDPGCQCCHCIGKVCTALRLALGCHSNQGHTCYNEVLGDKKRRKRQLALTFVEEYETTTTNQPQYLRYHHHHHQTRPVKEKWWITSVSLSAVTDDLVRGVVSLTGVTIKVIRAGVSRAGAGPTVFPWTEHRVSKEPTHTTRMDNTLSNSQTSRMKTGTDYYRVRLTVHRGVLLYSPYSLYTPRCGGHRGLHGRYTDRGCSWGSPTGLVGSLNTDAPWLPDCTGTGL